MNQPDLWDCSVDFPWAGFSKARQFARSLNLKSKEDWFSYVEGKNELAEIPQDIPPNPEIIYRFHGWESWEDWLGIDGMRQIEGENKTTGDLFRSKNPEKNRVLRFKGARSFARKLGFEYKEEWELYVKGLFSERPVLPENVPGRPDMVYMFTGWKTWKDWLMDPERMIEYPSFKEAREFVHCFRLTTQTKYRELLQQEGSLLNEGFNGRPLPNKPDMEYSGRGWISWDDFLGTHINCNGYEITRTFIHSLKLKDRADWNKYCNGELNQRPSRSEKVFIRPDITYKEDGWISWHDWLGVAAQGNKGDDPDGLVECRCKGRLKNCPDCDGKGYLR